MLKLKLTKPRIVFASIITLLALLYFSINYIVLTILRHKLNQNPNYQITIGSVYINPFIGSYYLNNLEVREKAYPESIYFSVNRIEPKIQWSELIFHGRLVGKIIFSIPYLNFVNHDKPKEKTLSIYDQWQYLIEIISPLDLNVLKIKNGRINYSYFSDAKRKITFKASAIDAMLINNSCVTSCNNLGAQLISSAQLESQGQFYSIVNFDPSSKSPKVFLQAMIQHLNLKDYNTLIKDKTKLKVKQGFSDIYIQFNIKNNQIDGFTKIFLNNVQVKPTQENVFNKLKAGVAQSIIRLFKNTETQESATQIPITGKLDNPKISTWQIIISSLRHAFVAALSHDFNKTTK